MVTTNIYDWITELNIKILNNIKTFLSATLLKAKEKKKKRFYDLVIVVTNRYYSEFQLFLVFLLHFLFWWEHPIHYSDQSIKLCMGECVWDSFFFVHTLCIIWFIPGAFIYYTCYDIRLIHNGHHKCNDRFIHRKLNSVDCSVCETLRLKTGIKSWLETSYHLIEEWNIIIFQLKRTKEIFFYLVLLRPFAFKFLSRFRKNKKMVI